MAQQLKAEPGAELGQLQVLQLAAAKYTCGYLPHQSCNGGGPSVLAGRGRFPIVGKECHQLLLNKVCSHGIQVGSMYCLNRRPCSI